MSNLFGALQALNQTWMYTDTMTVKRQIPIRDDYGGDDYADAVIYQNISCRLSQRKKSALEIAAGAAPYKQDLTVFTAPGITVLPNDILEVMHHGALYTLRAALPFAYPTHQEIPVDLEEDA